MQFYKKRKESNSNNEYIKMISSIKSDIINNLCFECGTENPQYISINNAVFICKDCVSNHLTFHQEISRIILNDLYSLNLSEIKALFLGGNRKLIQFINFDFPGLKQLPPEILYKTLAVDYYRKNLKFLVNGGRCPLPPSPRLAYNSIEGGNEAMKNYVLSPKIGKSSDKYFNSTELDPIIEGKDEFDEKENNEENNGANFNDKEKEKEKEKDIVKNHIIPDADSINIKNENESTLIFTPQKHEIEINNNNDSNNTINYMTNSINNKSFQNEKNLKINFDNIIKKYSDDNNRDEQNKNKKTEHQIDENDEVKFNSDKNISEIKNDEYNNSKIKNNELNNNLNDDILGDDNTIKIIDGYMNFSKDNDSSEFIKSNKENNDLSRFSLNEKKEEIINAEINDDNDNKYNEDDKLENKSENNIKNKTKENIIRNNINNISNSEKKHNRRKTESEIIIKRRNENKIKNNEDNEYSDNKKIIINKNQNQKKKKSFDYKEKKENKNEEEDNSDNINKDNKVNKNNKMNIKDKNIKSCRNEKKNSKNIIIVEKNKIIKKKDFSSEEQGEEEEEEEEEKEEKHNLTNYKINSKNIKVTYPKKRSEKNKEEILNLTEVKSSKNNKKITKPHNHLRAKISTSQTLILDNDDIEKEDYFTSTKKIKSKKIINKKDADFDDDFFSKKSSFGTGFINPLKYLKKSFQKKQNEKFENEESDEDSYEEEDEDIKYIQEKGNNKMQTRSKIYEVKVQSKKYNTFIDKKNDISDNSSEEDDDIFRDKIKQKKKYKNKTKV